LTQPDAKWVIPLSVDDLTLHVVSIPFWLPATGATVTVDLPDGTDETAVANENGYATLDQLPQSNYVLLINYQFLQWTTPVGLASLTTMTIDMPSLFQFAFIVGGLAVAGVALRKRIKKGSRKQLQNSIATNIEGRQGIHLSLDTPVSRHAPETSRRFSVRLS
jgi:hypothetical protein